MMRFLFFLLAAVPAIVRAQPVITSMQHYTAGMSFHQKICDTTIDPGDAGPNQHWLFIQLQPTDSLTTTVMAPASTPYSSSFPSADIALKTSDGRYTYVQKTAAASFSLGDADTITSMITSYYNTELMAKRPVSYTDTAADTFAYANPNNSGVGTVQLHADGWGMLHLPNANYMNVLRIRSVIRTNDTIHTGPAFITIERTTVSYSWYDNAHQAPLLVWDSTHVLIHQAGSMTTQTVLYLDETATGVDELGDNAPPLTAAFDNNRLLIRGGLQDGKTYQLAVFASDGRKLADYNGTANNGWMMVPLTAEIAPGIYLLYLEDGPGSCRSMKLIR